MFRALVLSGFAVGADAHGSLVIPPSRNNHGHTDPLNYSYSDGGATFHGLACAGDACLWFNQGCYIGCPKCSMEMPPDGNMGASPPNCDQPIQPTLPSKFRTWNIKNLSEQGDWTRFHPWRAPGRAPVADPCGTAGGYREDTKKGGQTPKGAKRGDLGSTLPPLPGVDTEWIAGGVAEVGWTISANHGGGWLYSLCPKEEALTEACFQNHSLSFVGSTQTIRWLDGSRPELELPAIHVAEGTFPEGSVWRQMPVPACNCDMGDRCALDGNSSLHLRSYADEPHANCTMCTSGVQFPAPFFEGCGHMLSLQVTGIAKDTWAIVDRVHVPEKPGDYVLRWRWDVEQNPQVWTNCADISIVEATKTIQV